MSELSRLRRSVILVTGAPRSGTTPVGSILARAPGAQAIYEPWGPTGDVRFKTRFPIPGTGGLSRDDVCAFVRDLAEFNIRLKRQVRASYTRDPWYLPTARKIIGTRSRASLLLARINKRRCTHVIWKDPHAVMAVPDIIETGLPVVVTMRPALAHAASYKRLGWRPVLSDIYPRFEERYGRDIHIEAILLRSDEPSYVEAAAALWRMAYSVVAGAAGSPNLHLLDSKMLAYDEISCYQKLFKDLGLSFDRVRSHLTRCVAASRSHNRPAKAVHDWTRSIAYTNSYWQSTLSREEIRQVDTLTRDIELQLFSG